MPVSAGKKYLIQTVALAVGPVCRPRALDAARRRRRRDDDDDDDRRPRAVPRAPARRRAPRVARVDRVATDDDASASRESSSGAFYTLVPYDRVGDVDADP